MAEKDKSKSYARTPSPDKETTLLLIRKTPSLDKEWPAR